MNTTNNHYNWEICPRCLRKTRRSNCLVCRFCRALFDRIDIRNAKILASLASGDTRRKIVDKFRLVLIRGRRGLRCLQGYRAEAVEQKEERGKELWKKAELGIVSYMRSKETPYLSDEVRREARIEILKGLKNKDEEFHQLCREVIKWEKSVESLQIYLAGIEKKRRDYQEKKETAKAQEAAVV